MSPAIRSKSANPGKRVLKAVAMLATAGLAVASLVALATDNLHGSQNGGGLQVLSGANGTGGGSGSQVAGGTTAPANNGIGAGSGSSGSSSLGSGSSASSTAASSASAGGSAPAAGTAPASSSSSPSPLPAPTPYPTPGPSGPGPAPAPAPKNITVLSTVLQASAFGSHVVLPLLCGVGIGAFGPFLTDPNLAQLATTISSSCVKYGNEGQAAFTALNNNLAALAAANPAVDPFIAQLAKMFNTVGSGDGVPFASSLIQLGQLISFFEGSPQP
jgi:hypothetical protein